MLEKDNRVFINHVKGLFDPRLLLALRARYVELESSQINETVSERERLALARGESTDQFRMMSTWYDVWRDPKLVEKLSPYTYVTYPVQVRHVRARTHHVPWHQDIGYMRLLGDRAPQQIITCFIPLEPEPSTCTTIQFALPEDDAKTQEIPHVSLDGFGAGIDADDFKKTFHFDLSLGDALVFGDHAIHRTYLPPGCDVNRRSLEFRLIMPAHAVIGRDYFDIEKQCFIKMGEHEKTEMSSVG